jgi:hypothetical protein
MGFLGKIGDVFHKIEYHTSNAPETIMKHLATGPTHENIHIS